MTPPSTIRWILALVGLGLGLLVADLPMNNSWEMSAIYYSIKDPVLSYLKPKVDMETLTVIYRPLWIFIINGTNALFGMNFFAFHALKALILAAFGPSLHWFFTRLAPDRPRAAALASALCLVSYPALTSTWMVSQEDVLTTMVYLWSLTLFLGLGDVRFPSRESWMRMGAFAAAAFLSFFIKETSRAFSLVTFLACIAARYGAKREFSPAQLAGAALGAALTVLAALPSRYAPEIPWNKLDPTPEHLRFLLVNGVSQLHQTFFVPGTMFLAWAAARRFGRGVHAAWGVALAALAFSMPLFERFDYFGFIVFDRSPVQLQVVRALFIGVLGIGIFRSRFPVGFLSLATLACLGGTIYATAFISFVREDVSTRTFLPAIPFVAWLTADAMGGALRRVRVPGGGAAGVAGRLCFGLFACGLVWRLFAGGLNALMEFRAHSPAEYDSKIRIAGMNFSQASLLYMNDLYPTGRYDLALLTGRKGRISGPNFHLIEPFKKNDDPSRLKTEFCLKSLNLIKKLALTNSWESNEWVFMLEQPEDYDMNKRAVVHLLWETAEVPGSLRETMKGRFQWADDYSAAALTRGVVLSPMKYWDFGLATNARRWRFDRDTLLSRFLARHGRREYDYARPYFQVFESLEQLPAMALSGRPLAVRLTKRSQIWTVDLDALDCPCRIPSCVDRYREER